VNFSARVDLDTPEARTVDVLLEDGPEPRTPRRVAIVQSCFAAGPELGAPMRWGPLVIVFDTSMGGVDVEDWPAFAKAIENGIGTFVMQWGGDHTPPSWRADVFEEEEEPTRNGPATTGLCLCGHPRGAHDARPPYVCDYAENAQPGRAKIAPIGRPCSCKAFRGATLEKRRPPS
jgi:hypothetical protein